MKSFSELFKKYKMRAEFDTFAAFGNALAENGYYYDDSIYSHWCKGTRIPSQRKLLLTIIKIFVERQAIKSREEADELLASTGLGYLTDQEARNIAINKSSRTQSNQPIILIVAISFFALLLGGIFIYIYSQSQVIYTNTSKTVPSAVTEPKKLVIGIDATLEPMEYIVNDKLMGFDVDLGTFLAKEMNADIEFKNIVFDNLFNSLDQRQINMIISAVTITEERKLKYDFSDGYLNAGQVIITKKDNYIIQKEKDLHGKRIATQTGTTNEIEALKHTSDKYVFRYPDFVHATQAVVDGKVDALFTDLPNAKRTIEKYPELKIVSDPFTEEYYGIVFIKNDPSVTQVNEALTTLRETGVLDALEKRWLK